MGRSTTNPDDVILNGGSLLPLGGTREFGGHKRYCLAFMVDVLSGVLPGAGYGPFCPVLPLHLPPVLGKTGNGIGHAFWGLRPGGVRRVGGVQEGDG